MVKNSFFRFGCISTFVFLVLLAGILTYLQQTDLAEVTALEEQKEKLKRTLGSKRGLFTQREEKTAHVRELEDQYQQLKNFLAEKGVVFDWAEFEKSMKKSKGSDSIDSP